MAEPAPEEFAREWIAAWNRSDADAVLASYADEAVFVSPLAADLTGSPEIHGKVALREYWTRALRARSSRPRFRLESFAWDGQSRALLIVYASTEPGGTVRKCELMHFRSDGKIYRGEAFVGSTSPPRPDSTAGPDPRPTAPPERSGEGLSERGVPGVPSGSETRGVGPAEGTPR